MHGRRRPQVGAVVSIETGVVSVYSASSKIAASYRLIVAVNRVVIVQQIMRMINRTVIANISRIRLRYGTQTGAE